MIGKLYPPNTELLIPSEKLYTYNGEQYYVALTGICSPVVRSDKTDNVFVLTWEDVVKLAIDAGILKKVKVTEEEEAVLS